MVRGTPQSNNLLIQHYSQVPLVGLERFHCTKSQKGLHCTIHPTKATSSYITATCLGPKGDHCREVRVGTHALQLKRNIFYCMYINLYINFDFHIHFSTGIHMNMDAYTLPVAQFVLWSAH